MQDVVDRTVDVDVLGDIVPDELKVERTKVGDVAQVAGHQVVDADDGISAREQRFAEM